MRPPLFWKLPLDVGVVGEGNESGHGIMRNVLLVQSDQSVGEILKASLQREGFRATLFGSVGDIPRDTAEERADLVVLDESSGPGGVDLCMGIRLATSAPILVLSSVQAEQQWAGVADDVLAKPFAVQDLLAKSSALVGRGPARQAIFLAGDIALNLDTHRVTRGTRVVHLGPTEFRVLHLFLGEPQRLWSRAEIVDRIWSPGRDERIVDVTIKKLRAALNRKGDKDAIRTVRHAGYGLS